MSPRHTERPVEPLFLERWSPRAFDGSEIPEADLLTLFDAARWAPSAFNYQPWRFLYARRQDAAWAQFLDLLMPFNQAWAANASVLIYVLSDSLSAAKLGDAPGPFRSHSFDAGAAWALLALQATRLGYQAHGMTGVEFDRARIELNVPDRFHIEAAIAVGRQGDPGALPDGLRQREFPSDRKPVEEFAFPGTFPG